MSGRAEDTTPGEEELIPRSGASTVPPVQSGFVRRDARASDVPTRHMEGGVAGFVSRIDEIRRLYVEGATDEALLLAGTVSPPPQLGWSLSSVPVLARTHEELLRMPLDHRAGFFLAHVDGASTLETLLDIVPMPENEVLALVESLVALGVIRLDTRGALAKP
jgi:hypothetical protein